MRTARLFGFVLLALLFVASLATPAMASDVAIDVGTTDPPNACSSTDWQGVSTTFETQDVTLFYAPGGISDARPSHCKLAVVCRDAKICSKCVRWGECGEGPDTYRCCKFKIYWPCFKYRCCFGHK